ncbi:MAG: hypothetical protein U1C18_01325, partial [Patescibacteria group bacterium]|nr:hypothetical protein [Patescibacteria group bacterium]
TFGFWYQEHKTALVKALVAALVAVNAGFWIYTFYGVALLAISMQSDDRLYADLSASQFDTAAIHQANAPQDLAVLEVFALASATESVSAGSTVLRADFLALVENPNTEWIMRVAYSFAWEGGRTEQSERIVLPESQTYLGSIGAPVSGLPGDASLETSISWERVRDPRILVRPRAALSGISVETVETASPGANTDIVAAITNASQYTIIAPMVLLVAESAAGQPVAAWVHTETLESGKSIAAERRFVRTLPLPLNVSAHPDFDLFDEGAYELRGPGFIPF